MNKTLFSLFTKISLSVALLAFVAPVASAQNAKKLLVVTVTKGFRHGSIPTAEKVLQSLADKNKDFTLDFVRDDKDMAEKMTAEALKQYDGFIFANTTGVLPLPDKKAFLNEIHSGKGFLGMHSASDTFHFKDSHDGKDGIDPYTEMLGGEFLTHNAQVGVECLVQDPDHPATKGLGESYCIEKEEIYLLQNYDPSRVHELLILDKHPNHKKGFGRFPIAWTKSYGQGRVFYTSLGHNESVWENKLYQGHILGAIRWSIGLVGDKGK